MPRQYVSPPSFASAAFGLLSVVQARWDEPDAHWRAGVQWQPVCGTVSTTFDSCLAVTGTGGPPPSPPAKAAGVTDEPRGASPFTVYAEFECSPAIFAERAVEVAREALTRMEAWQVERAFWTGLAGGQPTVWPHLAADGEVRDAYGVLLQSPADEVNNTAVGIVEGLGLVEQALAACYGGVGVIHVPAVLGPALATNMLAVRDGSRLRTPNGNLIALGGGYAGTAPDGADPAAGTAWIYATGPVFAYRSGVEVMPTSSVVNRSNNTVQGIAERTYLLGFDCCHIGALISTAEGGTP